MRKVKENWQCYQRSWRNYNKKLIKSERNKRYRKIHPIRIEVSPKIDKIAALLKDKQLLLGKIWDWLKDILFPKLKAIKFWKNPTVIN